MIFFIDIVKVEDGFFSDLANGQFLMSHRIHIFEKLHMLRSNRGNYGNVGLNVAHKSSHFTRAINTAFLNDYIWRFGVFYAGVCGGEDF